jgi:hypothetical protein
MSSLYFKLIFVTKFNLNSGSASYFYFVRGFSILGSTYHKVPLFHAARREGAERRMQIRDSRLNTAGEASTVLSVLRLREFRIQLYL